MTKIQIITIAWLTAAILVAVFFYGHYAHGASSSSGGLKVIVKISYGETAKIYGAGKKAVIDFRDSDSAQYHSKYFNPSKFPKTVTIQFGKGEVSVGEAFSICLSSFKYDEGDCTTGINSPKKSPEKVSVDFPT